MFVDTTVDLTCNESKERLISISIIRVGQYVNTIVCNNVFINTSIFMHLNSFLLNLNTMYVNTLDGEK